MTPNIAWPSESAEMHFHSLARQQQYSYHQDILAAQKRQQASQDHEGVTPQRLFEACMEACRSGWKDNFRPWTPWSQSDCQALVDIMSQGRFSEIDHILVLGLSDMDLTYVREELEMESDKFVLKHHHYEFFSIIQVVKRLERLFARKHEAIRVEVEDREFTSETREGLEALGVKIIPASQGGVFGNASPTTLVYDARRFQTDLQKHIQSSWESNDGPSSKSPAAVITDRRSVRLERGSRKVDPIVESEYYLVSLSSRLNSFTHEGSGTMAQAKGLAQLESHLTQDEYTTTDSYAYSFDFRAMMVVLSRKDLTKDFMSLCPRQHLGPEKLCLVPKFYAKL